MTNPIEAIYNQYLAEADRGRLPTGITAKSNCRLCHGRGLVTKVTGHSQDGKPIRQQEGCECVRRRIISAYHAEMRKLHVASASATSKPTPQLPKKDDLQRVDRLEVQLQARQRKLKLAQGKLQEVDQGTSNAVNLLTQEIEDLQETMRQQVEGVERIDFFRQRTVELMALLDQTQNRLTQERQEALKRHDASGLQVQKNRVAIQRERARVAQSRGQLVQVVACRVRERDQTRQKLNKLRRLLGMSDESLS